MRNTTNLNEVTFLMDGAAFFTEIRRQLQAVTAAGVNANTYVRMGFWAASHAVALPDPAPPGPDITLSVALRAVATAGHDVKVILPGHTWSEQKLAHWMDMVAQVIAQNAPYDGNQTFATHFNGVANISVYLEPYIGWFSGASQHQKIAIFSINGQRTAIVGGMNLSNWYLDTPNHNRVNPPYGGMAGIHDTAVMIEGPATDAVEQEWTRRWNKSGRALQQNNTAQNTNNIAAVQQTNGNRNAGNIQVTIATTNSESNWGRQTDIQDLLLGNIRAATGHIYFENFCFCDPSLVSAVAGKLRTNNAFPAFIMVRSPQGQPYDFLHFITNAKLALENCTSITLMDRSVLLPLFVPPALVRGNHPIWEVQESWNFWSTLRSNTTTLYNRWLENDGLLYNTRNSRWIGYKTAPLLDITNITGGFRLYSPVYATANNAYEPIYLHSKLAIFGNIAANANVLVVGSANFNYRSMIYDGEMSAFMTGNDNFVNAVQGDIFGHFDTGGITPLNWVATAATNNTAFGNSNAVNGNKYILPKPIPYYNALPHDMPEGINITWV